MKTLHQPTLVGVARHDRLAVDAVDDSLIGILRLRRATFNHLHDYLLGELVIFRAIFLEFLHFLLENESLALLADNLNHRAPGSHAKFREEIANEVDIAIVHPVENHGIDSVYYYNAFYHVVT